MPLGIKEDTKKAKQSKKDKSSDADDAQAILDQMQAKEDNGDCAFC